MTETKDPDDKHITLYSDGYYFWDEADLNRYVPYKTKQEARDMLTKYAEEILEGRDGVT